MSNENKHLTWKQCYAAAMRGAVLYKGQAMKALGWWFFTRLLPYGTIFAVAFWYSHKML